MGSYNYEALHKHTPAIKRPAWLPDTALAANHGYLNGLRPMEPYNMNVGYANPLQDHFLLAQAAEAQAQALLGASNGVTHYGLTKYNLPSAAGLGLIPPEHLFLDAVRERERNPIRRAMRDPMREPRRRERRPREPAPGNPEPVVREPVRALSTSQSPAPDPEVAGAPDAGKEPTLAGMIFGCTSDTYIECMQLKLFALPAANKNEVLRVAPGTKLFLYNYRSRELSGIFEATSHGDMDLMPDAFQGFFPAQVRIQCVEKCPNLPLKAFKEAMSENFEKKNKFKYSLNDMQVRKLVALFRQELKFWQKEREQQQYKIMSSGLQPGLRPGYPNRNEVNLLRHLPNDQMSFLQAAKRARMY